MLETKLANKEALQKFGDLIAAQGGNARVVEDVSLLPPQARFTATVEAPQTGFIHRADPLLLGEIAMELGAGRATKETVIDLAVGLEVEKKNWGTASNGAPPLW